MGMQSMAGKTNNKMAQMKITDLLHRDHQKVRDLFFLFKESEKSVEKERLVQEILTELFIHSKVEEEIVYPVVAKEKEDGKDLADEAETEHRVVKFLMAELSEMRASDEQFEAKVLVLSELVGHHIREEEKEMFKKLQESDADLEQLAQKAEKAKQSLMEKPLPAMEATLSIDGQGKTRRLSAASSKKKGMRSTRTTRSRKSA